MSPTVARPQQAPSSELVDGRGYLDLRDEGYGFLRVNGYLPSRDDAYISVKLARQYGLRKGDHVTGTSRPAGRNEKNPALLEIAHRQRRRPRGGPAPSPLRGPHRAVPRRAAARSRTPTDPTNMTARIIDLDLADRQGPARHHRVAAQGRQDHGHEDDRHVDRAATTPRCKLIVLLIDERPEEVTDMRRTVKGEVIASTFDRPSDEHTHVAELAIEKAKRMVEQGEDVVVILDGITRLARAYNLAAPASGRIMSGGIDAGALYPPKKFFGAARNVEEGGSLTILATALVETEQPHGRGDLRGVQGHRQHGAAPRPRAWPSAASTRPSTSTRRAPATRSCCSTASSCRWCGSCAGCCRGLAADGNAAPGLELLIDRLKTFRTNDEFLNEIAKAQTPACQLGRSTARTAESGVVAGTMTSPDSPWRSP